MIAQREHARQLRHRRAHGLFQIPVEVLLDQVRDDLGVGLGLENVCPSASSSCFSAR